MKLLSITVATALLALAGATASASEPRDEKKEKKICKSEKITGSLTRVRRVCLTEAQWADMAANTNRTLDRVGRSANHAAAMADPDAGGAGAGHGHTF